MMWPQKGSTYTKEGCVVRCAAWRGADTRTLGSARWPAACATSSHDTDAPPPASLDGSTSCGA